MFFGEPGGNPPDPLYRLGWQAAGKAQGHLGQANKEERTEPSKIGLRSGRRK